MSNNKLGTQIFGIGSHSSIDSSGEKIDIEGIDISSLEQDGVFNWEHKSEGSSQIIGKITEATKIMKAEDCKDAHHKYMWEKANKMPFLYIRGILFDKFNHSGALDALAMFKFDQALDKKDTKQTMGFSIEGSRLDKEGNLIKKCIARKISATLWPCHKLCIAEILEESPKDSNKMISLADLKAAFKKAEEMEDDLNKTENDLPDAIKSKFQKPKPNISTATGEHRPASSIVPKRTFQASNTYANQKLKSGDRIQYPKPREKAKKGKDIYKDPETWKSEVDCMSNSRKAILNKVKKSNSTANIKTQMMLSEEMDKSNSTANIKTKMMMSEDKAMKRTEVLKNMSQEAYDLFPKKEELLASIRKTMPDANENEIMAFAKTFAYLSVKKQEIKLAEMADESSLNDEN